MSTYTIVGGVNGSGKSSLTGVLKNTVSDLGTIIDVDKITAELNGDMIAGGKEAIHRIEKCIEKSASFTQETTLSGFKTERTAKRAKELGYKVRLYYVALDTAEECLHRIENRVKLGGHDIDSDDVIRRFQQRWDSVAKVLPYCDQAEFYDNRNGFSLVAVYKNGELLQYARS